MHLLPDSRIVAWGAAFALAGALGAAEAPSTVVTTVDDVVDPSDGVVSFREAVQALLAGQHRLNGDRMVSFAIPGARNPVIRWAEPFAVTNAAAFNPERPLMVDGATERGQVTFDGENVRSLFRVGEGAALELAHCTLTRGHSLYGGAVCVDGGGHLGLRGVTVRDSYASAMGEWRGCRGVERLGECPGVVSARYAVAG